MIVFLHILAVFSFVLSWHSTIGWLAFLLFCLSFVCWLFSGILAINQIKKLNKMIKQVEMLEKKIEKIKNNKK